MFFDEKTKIYFDKKIKQVFVYLTNRCQLRCKQCLYKPLLDNSSDDIDFSTLINILDNFKKFGAYKVSFLGGEPTLYYDKKTQNDFGDVLLAVKKLGYKYIRVDTNGQFKSSFLEDYRIKILDEITFSLDGHDGETNDYVRGSGSFEKCIANIKCAISLGYNVQITSCVHKYSCHDESTGYKNLEKLIFFAQKLGVVSINIHPIIKVGASRDSWIEDTNVEPSVWVNVYKKTSTDIANGKYSANVRIPMRFAEKSQISFDKEKYLYCPLQMGERALIMPDGQIKVCAFNIGTPTCVARFDESTVRYEEINNELNNVADLGNGVCCNQNSYGDLLPLCMSYKPNQKEIVWNNFFRS